MRRTAWNTALAAVLLGALSGATALAGEKGGKEAKDAPAAATTAAAGTTPAPASVEDQLQAQRAILEQMRDMMTRQQGEIDRLRAELDAVRAANPAGTNAVAASASAAAADSAVDGTAAPALPGGAIATAAAASGQTPAPLQTTKEQTAVPAPGEVELTKRVDDIAKRLGNIRIGGDLRFRYEGFFNQGFDAPLDVNPRNRLRIRVRPQITGEISKNFDWGIRLATGGFNDPISTNQTLSEFFDRKPVEIDRAYLHFATRTRPVEFEAVVGKFEAPWKRTPLTFDVDLQPEGAAETLRFATGESTPLRSVSVRAWQLPYRERSIGADAYIYGGQIAADLALSKNFAVTLAGTFHDFEQVNVIPPVVNTPPTLVNAGFDYGTTNAVVVNPFTGLPEFRSDFRAIDSIAELRYTGFGNAGKDTRWPLVLRAEFLHNTAAFDNQRDGGMAQIEVGRRQEKGDYYFGYEFFKAERDVFPSVFLESDFLQTNAINHRASVSYMYLRQVEFDLQYILSRRLQTVLPDSRYLNRVQLDVVYKF